MTEVERSEILSGGLSCEAVVLWCERIREVQTTVRRRNRGRRLATVRTVEVGVTMPRRHPLVRACRNRFTGLC